MVCTFGLVTAAVKIIQVKSLCRSVPIPVHILHVTVEATELHEELCLVKIALISVNVCLDVRIFLETTVCEIACFIDRFTKQLVVLNPLFGLLFFLCLAVHGHKLAQIIIVELFIVFLGKEVDLDR